LATARRLGPDKRELVRHHGLARELLAEVNVWRGDGKDGFVAAAKGAPEAVAELCRLSEAERAEMARWIDEMAAKGMRVLGVARASFAGAEAPPTPRDMPFRFQGLIGFADPLRATVPASVQECRSAGIRVVMVTGDYPSTALAIARQAGIDTGDVVAGPDIERMSDDALRDRVRTAHVFARTTPAQKLRIVEALKANGEIVGMTGDGVNDAPSLKAAHIGIAMGGRGTDVAREAAAIVLLDDDFGSIVRTVRLGRRIYDNLRKAMGYILAVHVPIAGLALLPIALGMPLVLTPMLIAFLEMIIDPGCSVVLEAEVEEKDVMNRPPRDPLSPLLPVSLVAWNLLQGALAFLVVAAIFLAGWRHGLPESEVRSLAFLSLVVTNIALLLGNRSFATSPWTVFTRPNPSLWLGLGGVAAMLLIVLGWPPARGLFGLGPLHADDIALCLGGALGLLLLLEAIKPFWRNRLRS
jgi:Ca2+-transporting ATPase